MSVSPQSQNNYNHLLQVVNSILEDIRQVQNAIDFGGNPIMVLMAICSTGNQILAKWNSVGPLVRSFTDEELDKIYLPWVDGGKLGAYYWEQRLKAWVEYTQQESIKIGERIGLPTEFYA